jgi:hypothetical protein
VLSWYDFDLQRVSSLCLDIDGSGGSSAAAADAISHSMMEKLGDASKPFNGQTTDSGGGGVLDHLRDELVGVHLVAPDYYLVAPCCLHGFQKPFDNATLAAFGEGGLEKRNVLQLVHTCYDMQQCYSGDLFATAWNAAKSVKPAPGASIDRMVVEEENPLREDDEDVDAIKRMQRPVLTRWWYVSMACEHLVEHFEDWEHFMNRIVAKSKSNSREWKIASNGCSLISEPRLLCDAWFIVGFARSFFHRHFKWLQGHDKIAQDYGYRGRHMLERYYLMSKDLAALSSGSWETDPHFAEFRRHKAELPSKMASKQELLVAAGLGATPSVMGAAPSATGDAPSVMGAAPSAMGDAPSVMGAAPSATGAVPGAAMSAALSRAGAMRGTGAMSMMNSEGAATSAAGATTNTTAQPAITDSTAASTIAKLDHCVQIFFDQFTIYFHKHFKTWKTDKDLVACAFAGNARVSTALAKWVQSGGLELPSEGATTCSVIHGNDYTIYLCEIIGFLSCSAEQLALSFLVKNHATAVDRLAQGESLWGPETADADVLNLKRWCQAYQIPLMTSTH